jgi:hypothetical protein
MAKETAINKRSNPDIYQIEDLADLASYVPDNSDDSAVAYEAAETGVKQYVYTDVDDGDILCEADASYVPKAFDVILPSESYEFAQIIDRATFEANYDIEPIPA